MTKNYLKESQHSVPTSDDPPTCDVNGIIAGLDYNSFVLLPGTRNARPGMKFAEEMEAPVEEIVEDDYPLDNLDYSSSVYESPSMPSMYFFPAPPPYWGGTPFLLPSRLDGKKSKKKNKNKKKRDKQRQQRLERDHLRTLRTISTDSLSPPTPLSPSSAHSPRSVNSSSSSVSSNSPKNINILSKTPEPTSNKKPNKKKRNKQRRRGTGRIRRASAPQYILHDGMDAMSLQFTGLTVGLPDGSSIPMAGSDSLSNFSKPGYSTHFSPGRRGRPFWSQLPLYGEAY